MRNKEAKMKVTMQTILAGPKGVARPGTVIDLPQAQAEELIAKRYARAYDKQLDAKAKLGLERPKTEA
jgi:hypothetical protein